MKKVLLRTISLITFAAVLLSTISASSKNVSDKDLFREEKVVRDATFRKTNVLSERDLRIGFHSRTHRDGTIADGNKPGQTPFTLASCTTHTVRFTYSSKGDSTFSQFIVPNYVSKLTIKVVGADGGTEYFLGGRGASIQITDLPVKSGDVFDILVGQKGGDDVDFSGYGGGGGGGSFVTLNDNSSIKFANVSKLLIAAGGGGGGGISSRGIDGQIGMDGTYGEPQPGLGGGTNGTNQLTGYGATGGDASGGGAGWFGNGGGTANPDYSYPDNSYAIGGNSPSNNAIGGLGSLYGAYDGGFGGGGGSYFGAGGGGGYSGGGGGGTDGSGGYSGGGGGSYVNSIYDASAIKKQGVDAESEGDTNGDGIVEITYDVPSPQISVFGNNNYIPNGQTATSATDFTDFGTTAPSTSLSKTFVIKNTDSTDLNVTSITLNNSSFAVTSGNGPFTLPFNQTHTFTVTFTSSVAGVANSIITINSDDCDEGVYKYTVKANVGNACTTPTITGPTSVCTNGNITLTGSGTPAASNAWTSSNPSVATVSNTGVVAAGSTAGTTTITYTVEGGCSQTTLVTVTAQVAPTFNQVAAICSGATLSALPTTSTNNITGTWSPALNNEATTTYTFTPDAGQCATTATMTITVNPLPTVSVSPAAPVINNGNNTTLTANGATTYTWSPSTGLSASSGTSVTASPTTTTTYTVTGTDANTCQNTSTVTVTVTQNPATALNFDGVDDKVTVNNSTLGNFGSGDFTVEMSVRTSLSSGVEYLVSKRNTCGGDNFFSLQIVDGKLNMEMAQNASAPTYYVALIGHTFISDGNWHHVALTRQMGNVNIYVDGVLEATSNATIANINNSYPLEFGSSVCNGQNGSVKFKGDMDEIRIWSRALCTEELDHYRHCELTLPQTGLQAYYQLNAGYLNANNAGITTAVDATGNGNNATLNNFGLNGSTSNWVAGTVSGTCTPFATGAASITGTNTICVGATTQLSASPSGGTWVSSNSTIASVSNSGLVTGNNPGSATITYTSLCGAVATTTITVNAKVTPTFTQVAAICAGTTLSALPTTSTDGITGTWSPALNNTATTTYTFTPDAGQCANTATMTITVNPLPAATITAENNIVTTCPGQFVTLHANVAPGYTYQWQKNGADISGETDKDLHPSASGNYTVVITNSSNCVSTPSNSITVTIEDVTAPVTPTLSDITGECSATAPVATTTDACAGTITGTTSDPLTYNTQGDHVIHWTFTDPSGNSTTADQHVIITDVTPPTVVCPGNISTTANTVVSGQSGAMVSFSATASDNCGTPTITYSQNPGTFFPVGTTTVTVTADDGHGHTATCTFDVTVTCAIATPTISAGGPTSFCPGGSVTLTSSSATGNVWSTGATTQSITVSATGTYSVTVNDGSCSAVSAGTTVTAQDVTAPVTPILSDITSECSATAPVATTTDACAGTITGTTSDPLTYNTQGDHVIHWTFTDPSGNSTTADQHVIIADVTPPTVVCPGNISTTANTVVSGQSGAMVSFSATASDNCGTPTITYSQNPGTFFPVGTTTVTVTADDGHGHTATCTFDVTVTCSVATPTISAGGPTSFCPGGSVTLTSSSATGNVWSTGATTQSITVSATGTYSVTVNDGSCSAVSAGISVTAQDVTAPVTPTLSDVTGECSATAPVATTTDACAGTITGTTSDPLTYNTQGDHVIHWTFTDPSGNSTTADQHVIITDVTPPTVVCPGNISTTANTVVSGQSGAMVSFSATASDNCGTPTITYSQNPGTFFPVGTTTVTVTADDGHGHTATCTFDVTVTCAIATPTISAGGPTSFCPGGSVTLTSSSATGNVWSTGATTQSITVSATGTYSVTVNDGSCSAVSAGISVTAQDVTAPVTPTLSDITGECSATAPVATTTDACAGTITGTTSDPLTYNTQGDHVIHWTFTDPSGNSTTADQHVIITDVTPPTVVCPGNISTTANTVVSGQSGAMVSFSATASDNCGTPTITYSQNPGTFFPTGTTTVTVTADDGHGHTATCTFDVVVNCVTPVFTTCPSDISKSTDAGVCGAVVNYVSTASGDPATTYSYAFTGATTGSGNGTGTGSVFNTGVTTVTVTASNICGNATCSFTVTVTDTEKPVITGTPSTINKTNDAGNCGAVVTWSALSAADNCAVVSFTSDHHSGDVFPVGTTTVTYTATDAAGNTTTTHFDIVVTDNENPVITVPSDVTHTADAGLCSFTFGTGNQTLAAPGGTGSVNGYDGLAFVYATATDNCGVTVTGVRDDGQPLDAAYPVGVTTITWTATDIHGHTVSGTQKITITDDENPVIVGLPGNISQSNDAGQCGAVVNWTAATATDNCPGVMIASDHHSGDLFPIGNTTVTYTATDAHGHTVTGSFTVTVTDTQNPVITGTPSTINKTNDAGACGAVVTWSAPAASDNCSIVSFTSDHHSGDVFPVGTTTVTYTATDAGGNTTTTHFDVVVTDNEVPVVTCPSGVTVTANTTESSVNGAHVTYGAATATDNCGVQSIVYSMPSGGFFPVGDNVVDVTVTDIHGNVSHCSFHVVVNCVTPVFTTCPSDISKSTDAGVCGAVVNYVSTASGDPATTYSYAFTGATTGSGNGTGTGSVFNTGVTTVTVTASNICGNATCSFTVTVTDTEKPVITGTPSTINKTNDAGTCGAVVTWSALSATDNCSVASFTSDHHSGDAFPVGTTTVTYTATDAAGNTSSSSFDVVVTDNEVPVVTCPSGVTVTANTTESSVNGAHVTYGAATATDNCGVQSIVYSMPSGSFFPVGDNVVDVTVTDIHGNVSHCSFHVVVNCVTPVFTTCPSDISKSTDAGVCGAVVNYVSTASGDPATTYSYAFTGATTGSGNGTGTGSVFNTGVTTVTVTASNICGNATCSFTVTVTDTEKPVITGTPSTINKTNDAGNCGAVVTWSALSASDNCSVASFTSDHHSGDVFPVGTTTVTYTATDAAGNTTTTHFDIVVTDNENPVITVPSDVTHTADAGLCSFTFGTGNQTLAAPGGNGSVHGYDGLAFVYATATDNCGVTVTGVRDDGQPLDAAYPVGVTMITWTATDIHGHSVSGDQKITITDDENPVIVGLPGNISQSNDAGQCGAVVNWTAATATDNCPGVMIASDHHSGDLFPIGNTTVTYTATDAHGHTVTGSFIVTVNDTEKPKVKAPGMYGVVSEPGKCGATIANIGQPLVSDNCGIASVTNDHPSGFYPVGTTTVTWIVTDVHGNVTDTAKQLITVIDNEKPTITAPANITVNNDPGQCGANVPIGMATAADNCGVFSVTNDHPSNYYPVGTTIVTWTVLDIHGFKAKTTQTITVIDNEPPVITVPSDVTHTADAGLCSFSFDAGAAIQTAPGGNAAGIGNTGVSLGVATATDNCAVTVTGVRDDGQPLDAAYPVGVTTITWTATDIHGNAVSGTQKVTITDDEYPVIVGLPGNINKGNDLNTCGAVVNWTAATATDNCPGVTIVSDHHSGDVFPLGTTLVTYTATDAHGHSVTGNFSVTVSDVQKPVVQCPADITVNASTTNNGQPGANVTFAATASDNCGVPVISYSVPSGSFFPVGTTTVTTTVDDGHGNTATCSFNVTVNCVPPVITVSSVPTSNTFTGGVPTSLYLGYGAQSTVLKTTVAGGGNYSYAWSGSGAAGLNSTTGSAPLFTPTEAGSYQFTVVATNGVGCQSSGTISICVTDIRVPGNMSSDDDDKVDDHASCDHKTHSAKDCPHKYEKDNKCDHKLHNDKDCPYKKGDGKYGDKDDHDKYDGKNRHDDGKNYSSKSGTKEHDDKDDHQVTCDHKAHSAWNCPHRYEKDNKCDHKAHSEKDCPYKDKKDDKDDHHATCDHKAHSAKDCPHKYEKDNKCDHKSHSEKDCPYKDKDDHDDHHEGDGEHGQDNYKVFICHVPPGNPSQHITLSISINAVAAHLANHPGDRLGSCEQAPCSGYTDLEKPVISCPPAITVDCSSSMVPSVTGKATATDNSGVVSVTYTDTDNQGSDATAANYYNYTITRTWKATDPAGNSSECSQLITVRDQVKPVINCPGNVTLTCAGDMGTATAGTATATDNSNGPVTITYSDRNSGDGIYRTWTATDASGNYATCTQKITVRDDVKPVITAPADVTAQCGTSTSPSVTGTAVATDNCNLATVTYSDYIKYNVITRTWKATDASGNYSTDVQKITIVDNVKPVITAPADKSISCGASTEPKYCGGYATGTDGCSDVTISYSDAMSGNVIVRTWKATDASGNYSTAVQNITIIDNVKPVITDPKDYTISCGASTEPKYCGGSATATDNCSTPVVTYSDVTVGNVITRTWKATDAAGNYSTSTQKITIVDNTRPVITDVPDITVSCNGSTAPSATGTATATDACSDVTVTYSDVVSGNKIIRTWKATDAAGNYSTSVQTITQGAAFDVDITSVPTSSTYTGGVSTNLYLGYGAQSTTLQTNSLPSGGAPYTYNWSGSYVNKLSNSHSAAPVFTPSTFGYYTFSVQVTNKYGCTSTESISICVTDIRVPGCNGSKVYVCHTTSGKYGKQQTLEVPVNQVSSHIGSGYNGCGGSGNDRLGSCDQSPCNITSANSIVSNSSTFTKEGGSETVTTEEDLNVVAMPNPSTTYFTLKVTSRNKEEINMRVLDAGGRVIDAKSKIIPNSTLQIGQNYSSGTYYAELIQGTRRKVVQLIKGRG